MQVRSSVLAIAAVLLAVQGCATTTTRHADVDAVEAAPTQFTILLENEHVRVIEYVIAPGQRDPWHTHPPKVSYVVSGGQLRIHLENGESFDVNEETGTAHWTDHLPVHSAENIGETPVRIVLIEVREAA